MSVLLIACCYWKRANNWGAIAAIVVGAALPVLALSLNLFVKVPQLDVRVSRFSRKEVGAGGLGEALCR